MLGLAAHVTEAKATDAETGAAWAETENFEFDILKAPPPVEADDGGLTLDIDGWEGPLDLLLTLARNQKVDLRAISILQLVEQYLVFIENARALKLELAADYLVMAAWLTYLKSALLLPKDPTIDPSPEELAMRLQLRLERLECDARKRRAVDGAGPDWSGYFSARGSRRTARCAQKRLGLQLF